MKQINIYFGKQQDSVLGSYADIVKLEPVDDEFANELVKQLACKSADWFTINTPKGIKIIRLSNVLWIDVNDVDEPKGDVHE